MYSRLLPDPTNLPGVVGQGAVFLIVGLAYYDVGGVGTWAAAHVPAACALRTGALLTRTPTKSGHRWGSQGKEGGRGGE